jgi:hypothetical protein
LTITRAGGNSDIVKDFISFLAGAIFIEELLADDEAPAAASPAPADDQTPPTDKPAGDTDEH